MKIASFSLLVVLCLVLPARADVVTVSGVGASLPLAEKLGEAYVKAYPGDEIRFIRPPLGSAGAHPAGDGDARWQSAGAGGWF
jgi:hypothetical protein